MKNFSTKIEGKTYWISRSIATAGFVFRHNTDKNEIQLLVEKRGKGAADFQGKLCCPCGYLDYDETLTDCITRECLEECGVELNPSHWRIMGINDKPSENHQNVTVRYVYLCKEGEGKINPDKAVGGEKDEIEDVQWLTVAVYDPEKDAFRISYEILGNDDLWAFNHNRIALEYLLKIFRRKDNDEKEEK